MNINDDMARFDEWVDTQPDGRFIAPFEAWQAGRASITSAQMLRPEFKDAARWNMLPAFFNEYQIDAMKLYRDIDAALAAREPEEGAL